MFQIISYFHRNFLKIKNSLLLSVFCFFLIIKNADTKHQHIKHISKNFYYFYFKLKNLKNLYELYLTAPHYPLIMTVLWIFSIAPAIKTVNPYASAIIPFNLFHRIDFSP